MLYPILKWLHVLSAIAALGANLTYAVWLGRGAKDPAHMGFALRGVQVVDRWIATPGYVGVLITGLAMVHVAGIPLTVPWVLLSLILYVVEFLLGIFAAAPMMKRQIQLLEAGQTDTPEYAHLANRGAQLGTVLTVLTIFVTFLMVVKPPLWAA